MTTHVEVVTNGNYVAEVVVNGAEPVLVGPGSMIRKQFQLSHGTVSVIEVSERAATPEEVAALPTAG